ncbi:MAG: TIGR01777 family oxidoreductase [Nocardioidaceae bacterium]
MRVVVGGASGFTGTALRSHLREGGHDVVALVRRDARSQTESSWDPSTGAVDQDLIESADVVVNLSGAPIGRIPWTSSYQRQILDSRVSATRTLARAVARSASKPALLSGSGMNAYGNERGPEVLTETSRSGGGFLCSVVRQWEDEAATAAESGARVCFLRTCTVIDRSGGVLRRVLPAFRLGLGARLGSGAQYLPCISLTDWVRAVQHLAADGTAAGAYNLGIPSPPTNAEFTRALGRHVHRPTLLAVPGLPLRVALRDLSEPLLGSLRVTPARLLDAGFEFEQPDLDAVLDAALR